MYNISFRLLIVIQNNIVYFISRVYKILHVTSTPVGTILTSYKNKEAWGPFKFFSCQVHLFCI